MGKPIKLNKRAGRKAANERNDAYSELCLDDKMLTNPRRFSPIKAVLSETGEDTIEQVPRSDRRAECKAKKAAGKPADYSKRTKLFAKRLPKKVAQTIPAPAPEHVEAETQSVAEHATETGAFL
jgi:hypothetical protein